MHGWSDEFMKIFNALAPFSHSQEECEEAALAVCKALKIKPRRR